MIGNFIPLILVKNNILVNYKQKMHFIFRNLLNIDILSPSSHLLLHQCLSGIDLFTANRWAKSPSKMPDTRMFTIRKATAMSTHPSNWTSPLLKFWVMVMEPDLHSTVGDGKASWADQQLARRAGGQAGCPRAQGRRDSVWMIRGVDASPRKDWWFLLGDRQWVNCDKKPPILHGGNIRKSQHYLVWCRRAAKKC